MGFNVGLAGTILIIIAAMTVYFNVVCTNLYPLLWLIIYAFDNDFVYYEADPTPFKHSAINI